MKKALILLLAGTLLLPGCGGGTPDVALAPPSVSFSQSGAVSASSPHGAVPLPANDGDIIEITEKLFIAQINDIYLNAPDYLGRTVKYEGLYKNTEDWDDGIDEVIHYVLRYGPGCCGYDGEAGFEVRWAGEYPAPDDWVEVIGTIEEEAYDSGYKLLYVNVTSLTVKEERGAEFVST